MEFIFGRRKTPEQMLRENQRLLNRAMRDLDRERVKLEQQEKKIIADIKKMAKQGQMVRRKKNPAFAALKGLMISIKRLLFHSCRTLLRSWLKIWSAPAGTSRSSS